LPAIGTNRSPLQVDTDVSSVVVGNAHVCYIVGQSGAVRCFGDNSVAQLGHNPITTPNSATPISVSVFGSPAGLDGIVALGAGAFHTCAIANTGSTLCWGAVNFELDNLGNPILTNVAFAFNLVPTSAVQLAAGSQHSCARLNDGTVSCWGNNTVGQLGQGNLTNSYGTALAVPGLTNVIDIASSGLQTCATTAGGAIYCWGHGHMGNGSQSATTVPTPTAVGSLIDARAAAIGTSPHTCVLRANGAVVCWGSGMNYQLGDGSASARQTPNAVSGGTIFWQ
jgi:alpha-tubulin suppressor-like RCC1 family protein